MSEILIGIISSALAVIITNPLSILRTKMMIVEEEAKYTYTNSQRQKLFDIVKDLVVNGRGLRNLETGLMPALSYYTVTNGIRLGFFSSMETRGVLMKENDRLSFANTVVVATGGALLGGFVASPLFVLKTQLQIIAGEASGQTFHPVIGAFRGIYKDRGITGFYRGFFQAIPIIVTGSVAQLVTFTYVKDGLTRKSPLKQYSISVSAVSALASSFVIVAAINPIQNALSKLHYQERRGLRGYKDSFKCMLEVEGFRGFYNGAFLSLLRVVPHNLVTLIVWDFLRRQKHLERARRKSLQTIHVEQQI